MAGGITGIIGIMNNYFAICNRFSDDYLSVLPKCLSSNPMFSQVICFK